jgi:hypothetical protein
VKMITAPSMQSNPAVAADPSASCPGMSMCAMCFALSAAQMSPQPGGVMLGVTQRPCVSGSL